MVRKKKKSGRGGQTIIKNQKEGEDLRGRGENAVRKDQKLTFGDWCRSEKGFKTLN